MEILELVLGGTEQRLVFIPFNLCALHRRGDRPSKRYSAFILKAVNLQQKKDFSLKMHGECQDLYTVFAVYMLLICFATSQVSLHGTLIAIKASVLVSS